MGFRELLYDRYVSGFKGCEPTLEGAALASYLAWWERKLVPLLGDLDRDASILEVGCGPGHMLELLARLGFTRVEGIDVSPEQIELAARRGLAARVAGVFDHLAASEAAYAAILGFDFIEHFDREELLNLASAIHRALAPGGRLILRTPNGAGLLPHQVIYGDLTHLTVFTPGSLEQLLRWAGFTGFRFAETGPVPAGFRGRARVLGWYLVKLVANAVRMLEAGKRQALWTENMICCCRKPG